MATGTQAVILSHPPCIIIVSTSTNSIIIISIYISSSSILAQYYWAMGHGYPCIYLPKPQLRHQHQHPTWFASFKLVCFFPPAKCLFPVAGLIFGWQLDVAACCSRVCLRSHPHLTPVNWCGTGCHGVVQGTMAGYCTVHTHTPI